MTTITMDESDAGLKAAEGYSKSADLLTKYIGKTRDADVLASMIVLRSLALEIYLKRLYEMDHHKSFEGQHLKQIFDLLCVGTRQMIREHYNRNIAESPFIEQVLKKHEEMRGELPKVDIEHVLNEWSEATADRRYFFEPRHNIAFLAFSEIERALANALKEVSSGGAAEQRPAA